MSISVEQLAQQAMSLSAESRARLADLLVESLDADDPSRIEKLWLAEARSRLDDIENGHVQSIPGPEALRIVRNSLSE